MMGMLDAFVFALGKVFLWKNLFYIFGGTSIGLIFGALPGLSSVVSLSIFLPLTYGMDPVPAMFFYAGLMGANPFGGSISAILINTPGTAQNIATIFDGYPMTQRGEAGRALGISATASGLGAVFGVGVLVLIMPLVRKILLSFGPPEFFMLVLFGLCMVVVAARGNMIKGLFAGGLGLLLSFMGRSALTGTLRFTFGTFYLWDGIVLIPFVIGVLAIAEIISLGTRRQETIAHSAADVKTGYRGLYEGVKDVFQHKVCFLRSASIGTLVGIIPGIGGAVANVVAYTVAFQSSSHPETFGKGEPEGVIAPESANNAKDGGSLLPTLGFGIPGSAEMAVLLGAFILHGLTPGPLLIKEHLDIVWTLILGLTAAELLASILGIIVSKYIVRISRINVAYIVPLVGGICLVGAFAYRGSIIDVLVAVLFGFVGFGLRTFGFPIIPMVMGYVLGQMAEVFFNQSLMISDIGYKIFFTRHISLGLFLGTIVVLLLPFVRKRLKKRAGHSR